jgi:PAS domain S-box-containing protein
MSKTEEWQKMLENASIGVHLVDENGLILWANQKELEFLGYSPAEYFNKAISDFHMDQNVIDSILNLLSSGEELHSYPARLKAKDGSIKYVLINSNVFWRKNKFVHTRCFTNEISHEVYLQLKKELEKKMKAA